MKNDNDPEIKKSINNIKNTITEVSQLLNEIENKHS